MINHNQRLKALQNQIRRIQLRIGQLTKASTRFSWYRLSIFLSGLVLAFTFYWINLPVSWGIAGAALLVFNLVAFIHRRTERSLARHEIWLEMKRSQAARMQLDWENIPEPPNFAPSLKHSFEIDLDITGKYSLHHLLDLSISQNGSHRLCTWLLEEIPDYQKIQSRQKLVRELKEQTRFRDKLLLNFRLNSRERLEGKAILDWLAHSNSPKSFRRVIWIQSALLCLTWIFLILDLMNYLPQFWLIPLLAYAGLYFFQRKLINSLLDDAIFIDAELKKSFIIFKYLEKYHYASGSALAGLCQPFGFNQATPSVVLKKLTRIMIAIGLRGNFMLGFILNLVFPWDYFWAFRLNQEKAKLTVLFPEWLNLCFELEALISLANCAYLNPSDTFPNIIPESRTAPNEILFRAEALGHPLIPETMKVRNSFEMNHLGEIVLVTGSNMSGKSTFLRTVGINLCLANAGAPVNATSFSTRLFRLFTCIKINDSLNAGVSQFYAEVKRLKALLILLEQETQFPILFLIDEIYKGTNNRERLIGSRAFISALTHQNALGVVSTHDLELTTLAEKLPGFRNYHFREEVKHGKMIFDYQLRTGPCPTTNALKIMEMEGLPVVVEK